MQAQRMLQAAFTRCTHMCGGEDGVSQYIPPERSDTMQTATAYAETHAYTGFGPGGVMLMRGYGTLA